MIFEKNLLKRIWLGGFGRTLLMVSFTLSVLYSFLAFRSYSGLFYQFERLYSIQSNTVIINFFICPLFLVILMWFWNQYTNIQVLLRFKGSRKKLMGQLKLIMINACLFVTLFNLPFFLLGVWILVADQSPVALILILFSSCLQFIGFNLLGNLQLLIQLKTNQSIVSFLIGVVLLQIPELLGDLLRQPNLSISRIIYLNNWFLPGGDIQDNLVALVVMSFLWLGTFILLQRMHRERGRLQRQRYFLKRVGLFNHKRLLIHALTCAIVLTVYSYLIGNLQQEGSMFEATLSMFNVVEFDFLQTIIPIFIFSLPFISFIYLNGDKIYRDYFERGELVLTRIQRKRIWFVKMMSELLKESTLFCSGLIMMTLGLSVFLGYHFELYLFEEVAILFGLLVLFFSLMTLLSNLVCFLTKSSLGGIVTITVFYASFLMVAYLYEWHPSFLFMIKWLPVSQIVMSWHTELMALTHTSFTFSFSFVYLLVGLLVCSGVLYHVFKKTENY